MTLFLFAATFAGNPAAEGATSSYVQALPQATGIAVGGDNLTRLIWNNINGTYALWTLNANGSIGTQTSYPASSTPVVQQLTAVAVGANNASRLLWSYYTSGQTPTSQVSLWNATDANPAATALTYNFPSGFYPASFAVGSNNVPRMLWDNANGQISLWNFADANPSATCFLYGPYSGWTGQAIAAGSDNKVRILWDNTDGRIMLWNQSDANPMATALTYGPYSGWTGAFLAVGPNNIARMLWTNPSGQGQVSLWNFADASPSATCYTYANPSGYKATGIAVGTDNLVRLLWSGSGTAQVWTIAADGTFTSKTYSAVPRIVVSPNPATLNVGGSQQFTAVAKDQNGNPLSPQPAIAWTSTGVGTITTAGVYSAGNTTGTATVTAKSGTVTGTATVTVHTVASRVQITNINNGSNLSGDVDVSILITGSSTGFGDVNLYIDGVQYDSGQPEPDGQGNYTLTITVPSNEYANGSHQIKIADNQGNSDIRTVNFNSVISSLRYDPVMDTNGSASDVPHTAQISATLSSPQQWQIQIQDDSNNVIKSFSGSGTSINVSWDGTNSSGLAVDDDSYDFTITTTPSGSVAPAGAMSQAANATNSVTRPIAKDTIGDTLILMDINALAAGATSKAANAMRYAKFLHRQLDPKVGIDFTKKIVIFQTTATGMTVGLHP